VREPDKARRAEAFAHILTAVTKARHLTHQLLTLARDELERWADAAIARHIDLGYEGPDHGVWVLGTAVLLRELIGNLVDNAIRYGQSGGRVTLSLQSSPILLTVDDDGPGIPAQERPLVLERFYRGQDGRGDGCGLGLPIVKEIAARHGAVLRILDHPRGRGTCIEIAFAQ